MAETLMETRDGTIVTLVINRPEKLNAMTRMLWANLGEAFERLSEDETVRCVLIRGAGERAFSPGNDISEFRTERSNKQQAIDYGHVMHKTIGAIANCRHPVVAQIHGICVGGGMEIASLADIRICGESSRFGAPINRLGLVMAYSEMGPLVRLLGHSKALEILLEGRIFEAQEALRIGLVSRVVPDAQIASESLATAERVAAGAPLVARWHKKFARRLADSAPISAVERDECFDCFDTDDFQIGYKAFLDKLPPQFIGR